MATPNHTPRSRLIKDRTGEVFGRLTVVSIAENKEGQKGVRWLCQCECGETRVILGTSLVQGLTKSCGCLSREASSRNGLANKTHGMAHEAEYTAWKSMLARCYNPKHKSYARYGGRGITVCDRWRHSFENFIADMGLKPSPDLTLERERVNEGYGPGNCVWASMVKQARNRTNNRVIEFRGEHRPSSEWAEIMGLNPITLRSRLKDGWDVERALTTPTDQRKTRLTSRIPRSEPTP